MNAEAYIRQHIRKILSEEKAEKETETKKSGTVRAVGVGRGRLKFAVKETGALAKEDPKKLMKNLKVGGVNKSKGELELLKDLLKKAANGTDEMSAVYSVSDKQPTAKDKKDGNEVESVSVDAAHIEPRDAQKYIEYTLIGATNAFGIKWKKNVEVTRSGNKIVVYLK